MPVYNSPRDYFEAALKGLLGQTLSDFEIILSDNASDEAARELYAAAARRDRRVRLIRHPENRGATANFEFVLREARAPLFAWAADDDLRHPDFLADGVRLLEQDETLIGVGYGTSYIDEQGNRIGAPRVDVRRASSPSPARRMLALGAPNGNNDLYGLYRTDVLRELDLKTNSVFVDWLMLTDLLLHGPIGHVEDERFSYRLRASDLDFAQRRAQHSGAAAPSGARDGDFYAQTALQFVAKTLTSSAPLSPHDRVLCAAAVTGVYTAKGWFTLDAFLRSWSGAKAAWAGHRFARSAFLAAEAVMWAPTFPFRGVRSRLNRLHPRPHRPRA